ncbi:hypothetical protein D3C84_657990 [compost metagenome]
MSRQQTLAEGVGDVVELPFTQPQVVPHRGCGRSRGDQVDAHVIPRELHRQCARLRRQRGLAGNVGRQAGKARACEETADKHHRGRARQFTAQRRQGVQRPGTVDRPLPLEGRHVQAVGHFGNPRAGHQPGHRAQYRGASGQLLQVVLAGDVPGAPLQSLTVDLFQGRQFTGGTRHRQHLGATGQQRGTQRQANPGTGAGDHRQTILKLGLHHVLLGIADAKHWGRSQPLSLNKRSNYDLTAIRFSRGKPGDAAGQWLECVDGDCCCSSA